MSALKSFFPNAIIRNGNEPTNFPNAINRDGDNKPTKPSVEAEMEMFWY